MHLHKNMHIYRLGVVLTEPAPSGQGMQAQEDTDKMFFLLSLHARQCSGLTLGLIGKEMLYVGTVTTYYPDFWNKVHKSSTCTHTQELSVNVELLVYTTANGSRISEP